MSSKNVCFTKDDINSFLVLTVGMRWSGYQDCGRGNGNVSIESLAENHTAQRLAVYDKNDKLFWLNLNWISDYSFQFEIPNENGFEISQYDYSLAWQDFLLDRYPDYASKLKIYYENKLRSIFHMFDVTGEITKDEYLKECAKYEARLSKLESGKIF